MTCSSKWQLYEQRGLLDDIFIKVAVVRAVSPTVRDLSN